MVTQKDFEIDIVLNKPLVAHLSSTENGEPRDSPVWFIWDEGCIWIFGTSKDSFVKRLMQDPRCAIGVVDFDLQKGILRHVGIRSSAQLREVSNDRLKRFVAKYLGHDQDKWNKWFLANIVEPLDRMFQIIPKLVVAKDVSFFKTGPELASGE